MQTITYYLDKNNCDEFYKNKRVLMEVFNHFSKKYGYNTDALRDNLYRKLNSWFVIAYKKDDNSIIPLGILSTHLDFKSKNFIQENIDLEEYNVGENDIVIDNFFYNNESVGSLLVNEVKNFVKTKKLNSNIHVTKNIVNSYLIKSNLAENNIIGVIDYLNSVAYPALILKKHGDKVEIINLIEKKTQIVDNDQLMTWNAKFKINDEINFIDDLEKLKVTSILFDIASNEYYYNSEKFNEILLEKTI